MTAFGSDKAPAVTRVEPSSSILPASEKELRELLTFEYRPSVTDDEIAAWNAAKATAFNRARAALAQEKPR